MWGKLSSTGTTEARRDTQPAEDHRGQKQVVAGGPSVGDAVSGSVRSGAWKRMQMVMIKWQALHERKLVNRYQQ